MFKPLVQRILAWKARKIIAQFKPRVVAITGSVGKTTTREAVALLLKKKYSVLQTAGNLNNEFGVPLTILQMAPAKDLLGWVKLVIQAVSHSPKSYFDILVLEYGIDHPGDMEVLANIARPHIVVETGVDEVHLEFFKNRDALIAEKASLLSYLPSDGFAVLNYDNADSRNMTTMSGNWQRVTYGTQEGSDYRAQSVSQDLSGVQFQLTMKTKPPTMVATPVLGSHHIQALLAAAAIGDYLGISPAELTSAAAEFRLLPGRLSKIEGIKGSTLIDSTYNSSPSATKMALETLRALPAPHRMVSGSATRKVAMLGDMLELGPMEDALHAGLVKDLSGVEVVICVGKRMKHLYDAIPDNTIMKLFFKDSFSAAQSVPKLIQNGDLVLIKGSQGVRMERVTKALMAHPEMAKDLLVRQSSKWQ